MQPLTRRDLMLSALTLAGATTIGCAGSPQSSVVLAQEAVPAAQAQTSATPVQASHVFRPGEKLVPDEMRISILGSSPIPRVAQEANSVYVELGNGDSFLFDCGSGVTAKYIAMGVDYARMDKVFLTHLHADHMSDLVFIYAFGPSTDRKTPLRVWGPTGDTFEDGTQYLCTKMKEMLKWHIDSFSFLPTGLVGQGDGYDIIVQELPYMSAGATAYEANGVKITHFPAVHARNGSISYRLEWNGLSMVFTGDTRPNYYLLDNARGVDVLIHEMVVPPEVWASENTGLQPGDAGYDQAVQSATNIQNSSHTPERALGYILSQTRPRLGVATHFQVNENTVPQALENVRSWYSGAFTIATDLLVLNVSRSEIRQRKASISDWAWYSNTREYPPSELSTPRYPSATAQLNATLLASVIPDSVYNG